MIFHSDDRVVSAVIPLPAGQWSKKLDSHYACWGGAGNSIPCNFESCGDVRMEVLPYSLLLLLINRI